MLYSYVVYLTCNVFRGIEFALEKMKKKEEAQITLKPEYAFGTQGCQEKGVPANATVVYDVTLVKFEKAKVYKAPNNRDWFSNARTFLMSSMLLFFGGGRGLHSITTNT